MKNKKSLAFTLAEVLITLAIIGIVAALTIPTLIANTQSAKFRSQFKKTLSTLNQAVKMNVAQYDWDFSSLTEKCTAERTDNPHNRKSICALLNGTLKGYSITKYKIDGNTDCDNSVDMCYLAMEVNQLGGPLYVPSDYDSSSDTSWGIQYLLSDSSLFIIFNGDINCTKNNKCLALIDVNGKTLPNKEVACTNEQDNRDIEASNYKDCTVENKTMGDVFPVYYYDSVVEPATNAGRYVLNTTK